MRSHTPALVLSLAAFLAAQDPAAARVERAAMLAHYATVEAELRQAPLPRDAALAARRLAALDHLRAYRERADFCVGADTGSRVPLFVDADGRRCAVGWLLDRTGHGDLTLAIERRCNTTWIAGLAGEPALGAWLAAHGLTLAEAARIQGPHGGPPFPPVIPPEPEEPPDVPDYEPADASRPEQPGAGATPSRAQPRAPSTPPAARSQAGALRGATTRGSTIGELGEASWLEWWEWNRGAFELPEPVRAAAPAAGRTVAAADPARRDAAALLAELTRSPDAQVRAAAVQALGRMGTDVDLATFLDDPAREVRLAALLAAGRSGTAGAAFDLGARARKPMQGETLVVVLAAMSLLEVGGVQRALGSVVDASLGDARPDVFAAASIAAATRSEVERRTAARAALRSATTAIQRAEAAQLLGPGADADDVATLTVLANDRSLDVRRCAALALGRSEHDLALPALQTAFELEHESLTRALQLLAIGDHGGAAGRDFLLGQLATGSKALRAHAALALGLWGRDHAAASGSVDLGERVAAALTAERNRDQQGAYLLALGLLRHAPARALLAGELATSTKPSVRGAAASALGLLGDRADVPELAAALAADSCPWVRQQVARALQSLGGDAVPALVQAMRGDVDATVQRAAAFALGGIADGRATAALRDFAARPDVSAVARGGAVLGLGRAFRVHEPRLPGLRFQRNWLLLPAMTAWAFGQEL